MAQQRATKSTVGQGLFAATALATTGVAGHGLYLVMTRQVEAFVERLHQAPYFWVPPGLEGYLDGSWLITAITASVIAGIHLALFATLAAALVTSTGLGAAALQRRKAVAAHPDLTESRELLRPGRGKMRPIVVAPNGRVYRNVAPPTKLRLKRAALKFKRNPQTPIERLEAALLEILYAHRQWPADPSGHHATTNLYEHSREVARQLRQAVENNADAYRLARVIGLGHDIGKILAYKKSKKRDAHGNPEFTVADKQHDELSAFIVDCLPELRQIDTDDQNTILTVLRYSHQDHNIPEGAASERVMTLMRALQRIDGLVTQDEVARVGQDVGYDELIDALRNELERIIPLININGVRTGGKHAEGFTGPAYDYIAVFEAAFRNRLEKRLSQRYAQALGLPIQPNRREGHPSLPYIVEALKRMGLIVTSYNDLQPRNATFSVKSGDKVFDWMFLLDRQAVAARFSDSLEHWGGWQYALRVLRERQPKEAPRTEPAEGAPDTAGLAR